MALCAIKNRLHHKQGEHSEDITKKANNEVLNGIAEVDNRLKIDKDNKARLFIDENCVNFSKFYGD